MSRTRKAALTATFAYTQYGLAVVSGFVLFPMVIHDLGAYDNGLWLATGEVIGYLLLGDLGVLAVLPWLIAARDGAGDRVSIARHLADGLAIATVIGVVITAAGAAVCVIPSVGTGLHAADWAKVRVPLAVLLGFMGVGFTLRPFAALLIGLQDVMFSGPLALVQNGLTIALTAILITSGAGMLGLAVAAGAPPLVVGVAALARAYWTNPDVVRNCRRPTWSGCRDLLGEGFGAWLAGLGVRLMTASNGLILAGLGRPDWGTVFAATGKAAQIAQPMCGVIPDSSLVGLSELHGEGKPDRTRRVVVCLLLLYLLICGAAAIALLIANPVFVQVWLTSDLYAGHYVSALIAVNLLIGSVGNGMYKVVAVLGNRTAIGLGTIAAGLLYLGLGYGLGKARGLAGLAEAAVITSTAFVIPFGAYFLGRICGISPTTLIRDIAGPWAVRSIPLLAAATGIGIILASAGVPGIAAAAAASLVIGGLYLIALRTLLGQVQWPARLDRWMRRLRLTNSEFVGVVRVPPCPSIELATAMERQQSQG